MSVKVRQELIKEMIIESGIPIPKARASYEGKYSKLVKDLGPENPLRVETRKEANGAAHAIRQAGYRAVIRKMSLEGQTFYRVWRAGEKSYVDRQS